MVNIEHDIVSCAIEKYGIPSQIDVSIEEMSELTQALIHYRRGRESNISEEVADVYIMLEQLCIIFECYDEVEYIVKKKLKRLEERMNGKS